MSQEPLPLTYECSPQTYGHVISPGHTYCHCNSLLVRSHDVFNFEETRDAVQGKIMEGLYRGESLAEILKVAVVQLIPLDPTLETYIDDAEKRRRDESGETLLSKYAVCHGCRVVMEHADLRCKPCAEGRSPYDLLNRNGSGEPYDRKWPEKKA